MTEGGQRFGGIGVGRTKQVREVGSEPIAQTRRGGASIERVDHRLAVLVMPEADGSGVACRKPLPHLRISERAGDVLTGCQRNGTRDVTVIADSRSESPAGQRDLCY